MNIASRLAIRRLHKEVFNVEMSVDIAKLVRTNGDVTMPGGAPFGGMLIAAI